MIEEYDKLEVLMPIFVDLQYLITDCKSFEFRLKLESHGVLCQLFTLLWQTLGLLTLLWQTLGMLTFLLHSDTLHSDRWYTKATRLQLVGFSLCIQTAAHKLVHRDVFMTNHTQ